MDGLNNLPSTLFPLFFVAVSVFIFFQFWRRYRSMQDTGPNFPELDSASVVFREKRVSGRSLLNWKTRLGGARNILEVVVTETELWIRAPMPFAIVAQHYDGLHRVPLTDVKVLSLERRGAILEFPRSDGNVFGFELRLRDVGGFIQALEAGGARR